MIWRIFLIPMFALVLLAALEAGRWLGRRRTAESDGFSAVEGAIYGLMGLLLAFSFSGAAARFEVHRELITQESNAIGTAWLRIDLLPEAFQPQLRSDFKNYLDARLDFYQHLADDPVAAHQDFQHATELQGAIWSQAVAAVKNSDAATRSLVLSSLNEMIDITTTRAVALRTHPPTVIFGVLLTLVLVSSLFAGHAMAVNPVRSWLHLLVYILVMAIVLYVIFDLEYPRFGLIRIDAADRVLVNLRNSM